MEPSSKFAEKEDDIDNDNKRMEINRAVLGERVPAAIGLSLFLGWSLSPSISFMSFIIYTDPDNRQNAAKARREWSHISKSSILWEKIMAMKTTRFLYH